MGSAAEQQSAEMRAPTSGRGLQRVTGTGATSNATTTALTIGEMATLLVGPVSVRIGFAATEAGAETAASATAPLLPEYGRIDWRVTATDCFVAAEAEDGASAFEFSVWTSSGA